MMSSGYGALGTSIISLTVDINRQQHTSFGSLDDQYINTSAEDTRTGCAINVKHVGQRWLKTIVYGRINILPIVLHWGTGAHTRSGDKGTYHCAVIGLGKL